MSTYVDVNVHRHMSTNVTVYQCTSTAVDVGRPTNISNIPQVKSKRDPYPKKYLCRNRTRKFEDDDDDDQNQDQKAKCGLCDHSPHVIPKLDVAWPCVRNSIRRWRRRRSNRPEILSTKNFWLRLFLAEKEISRNLSTKSFFDRKFFDGGFSIETFSGANWFSTRNNAVEKIACKKIRSKTNTVVLPEKKSTDIILRWKFLQTKYFAGGQNNVPGNNTLKQRNGRQKYKNYWEPRSRWLGIWQHQKTSKNNWKHAKSPEISQNVPNQTTPKNVFKMCKTVKLSEFVLTSFNTYEDIWIFPRDASRSKQVWKRWKYVKTLKNFNFFWNGHRCPTYKSARSCMHVFWWNFTKNNTGSTGGFIIRTDRPEGAPAPLEPFSSAFGDTATAGHPNVHPDVRASRRPDVPTSRRPDVQTSRRTSGCSHIANGGRQGGEGSGGAQPLGPSETIEYEYSKLLFYLDWQRKHKRPVVVVRTVTSPAVYGQLTEEIRRGHSRWRVSAQVQWRRQLRTWGKWTMTVLILSIKLVDAQLAGLGGLFVPFGALWWNLTQLALCFLTCLIKHWSGSLLRRTQNFLIASSDHSRTPRSVEHPSSIPEMSGEHLRT